ncbi:MAG: hypothetical protein L6Q97_24570 [Thermoanaerobaculia bacterium]|nr:hypothetical protein [Thermoanaerobaculia bacterium]
MLRLTGILMGVLLLFCRCNKEDEAPGFDMLFQQELTIPAGIGGVLTHHFYLKNISTRYDALLSQFGKQDGDITRIVTSRAAIAGIFGDADFSIVEEAILRVYQESDPTGFIEVAYRYPTPIDPSNNLDLIPGLADSKRIMSQDRFSIDLALRLRYSTTEEIPTRLTLQFKAVY